MNIEQLDLTEHVFRSVRGWLHRLYPDDIILIERRQDESLRVSDDGASTPDRPIWNLQLAAGPTWAEHTRASSMVSYTVKATRMADSIFDAQRTMGRVIANSVRPAGDIPLRGYNLVWSQQPDIVVGDFATTDWPGLVDIAVAAVNEAGDIESAPSARVTVAPTDGSALAVGLGPWPYGDSRFAVFAAAEGEPLAYQGSTAAPTSAYVLTEIAPGSTPPSNVSCALFGMRVDGAESDITEAKADGEIAWQATAQLELTVQVPRTLPAHLDDALVP